MNGVALFFYVGWAVIYAGAATAVLGGAGRAAGLSSTRRSFVTLFVILFFVVLTQHPFPDPTTLVCPVPKARPNLIPFHFAEAWAWAWRKSHTWTEFLREAPVLSVAMNLLLCGLIGIMLRIHHTRLRTAAVMGLTLSLAIELTQLTGLWGLYPCAFRKFDIDDLLLNTLGVALGFVAARSVRLVTAH